jgi:hypothetical protein
VRFLIEQDRPREKRFAGEKFFRQFKYAVRPEHLTESRRSRKHIPYVRSVALQRDEHGADLLDCIYRENILDDQKAAASESLMLLRIETHDRKMSNEATVTQANETRNGHGSINFAKAEHRDSGISAARHNRVWEDCAEKKRGFPNRGEDPILLWSQKDRNR